MRTFSPLQGTVIRVFSVPEGQRLFEFRRGMKRLALVLSNASMREVAQYEQTLEEKLSRWWDEAGGVCDRKSSRNKLPVRDS